MKNKASWELTDNEAFFINGIIRKHLPKNCLEIGVSRGGSSVLILNAIKDIKDSRLISIDLNNTYYRNENEKTGWIVKSRFPELSKNWSLYTGDQPHKFLMKLNIKFDFMFLDTAHISPGELFNIIETMPFLNENAIIILHDLFWHFHKLNKNTELEAKVNPPNLHIMSYLYGDKLIPNDPSKRLQNIGAIFLYKNQSNHYLDYFLALMTVWDYMPNNTQLNDLINFVKKYYNNEYLAQLFNESIRFNKAFFKKFNKTF